MSKGSPRRPDAYGIPAPTIRFKFCDNDIAVWKDMKEKAKEILERTGAQDISSTGEAKADFQKTDKPMPRAS